MGMAQRAMYLYSIQHKLLLYTPHDITTRCVANHRAFERFFWISRYFELIRWADAPFFSKKLLRSCDLEISSKTTLFGTPIN